MTTPAPPPDLPPPPSHPLELQRLDLEPFRRSDTGIDYVHSFDAPAPGPHVMINALTHGNELCGMHAVTTLLERGIRPLRGRLTLGFANVAAYERFAPDRLQARFVERDFNRLWRDDLMDADQQSVEAERARAMRPLIRTVDRLLDIHSTWHAVLPFYVVADLPRARALADALGVPTRQLILPGFRHDGLHMIDYAQLAAPDGEAIGLIVECGQHFAARTAETALATSLRFLRACGTIDVATAGDLGASEPPGPVSRYQILQPAMVKNGPYRLACSYEGFEAFAAGAIVAWDGDEPVRAPFDGAMVLAPRPNPVKGGQAFSWGRAIA